MLSRPANRDSASWARSTLCVRGVPTSMDYAGDQGDWGNSNRPTNGNNWVQLLTGPGPNPDRYAFQLTHVGTRGEWSGSPSTASATPASNGRNPAGSFSAGRVTTLSSSRTSELAT